MYYLGLDPGTRRAGLALVEALPDGPQVCWAADLVTERADPRAMVEALRPHLLNAAGAVLCSEYPMKYATNAAAHADIEGLRVVVRAVEGLGIWLRRHRFAPGRWKGQVPKHILHARIEHLVAPVVWAPLGPDARDAIGIALYGSRVAV